MHPKKKHFARIFWLTVLFRTHLTMRAYIFAVAAAFNVPVQMAPAPAVTGQSEGDISRRALAI